MSSRALPRPELPRPEHVAPHVRNVSQANHEPLLDAQGAAELLNVPRSWVLAEARADRIPHVRLGRYVRFEAAELEAWWQARRKGPRARTGARPVSRAPEAA
jgi:excisionase family DNA binding protein